MFDIGDHITIRNNQGTFTGYVSDVAGSQHVRFETKMFHVRFFTETVTPVEGTTYIVHDDTIELIPKIRTPGSIFVDAVRFSKFLQPWQRAALIREHLGDEGASYLELIEKLSS